MQFNVFFYDAHTVPWTASNTYAEVPPGTIIRHVKWVNQKKAENYSLMPMSGGAHQQSVLTMNGCKCGKVFCQTHSRDTQLTRCPDGASESFHFSVAQSRHLMSHTQEHQALILCTATNNVTQRHDLPPQNERYWTHGSFKLSTKQQWSDWIVTKHFWWNLILQSTIYMTWTTSFCKIWRD